MTETTKTALSSGLISDSNKIMRLQKFLARSGVGSRRNCEAFITDGRVCVNGKVANKLGTKVDPTSDEVTLDGKPVTLQSEHVTLLLNKPAGYVSTMKDPQGRPCVADLVPLDKYPNLFPCGRLDRLTTGLMIFTTDGEFAQTLMHPSHEIDKTYEAVILGGLEQGSAAADKLRSGVDIGDFITSPAQLDIIKHVNFAEYGELENVFFKHCAPGCSNAELPNNAKLIDKTFTVVRITIHEGKNRQVRRMFEAVGHTVLLLRRLSIGQYCLDDIELGTWQKL